MFIKRIPILRLSIAVGSLATVLASARADGPAPQADAAKPATTQPIPTGQFVPNVGAYIATDFDEFEREGTFSFYGGIDPVGVVQLWLNDDPVALYNCGIMIRPLDPWLRPGENRIQIRGQTNHNVYTKIGKGAFPGEKQIKELGRTLLPKGKTSSPEIKFDPGVNSNLPAWDELPADSKGQAESRQHAQELVDRLSEAVRRHDGEGFVRSFQKGLEIWKPLVLGKAIKPAAWKRLHEVVQNPKAFLVPEPQPLEFLVGRRAVLVYRQPEPGVRLGPSFHTVRLGIDDEQLVVGPIQCVRIKGQWIIWNVAAESSGVKITLPPETPQK